MPETINGLPLHPLLVHAPVVLIPMLLVLTILIVVRQAWRRSLGWWTVLLAAVATGAAWAAAESGENLAAVVGEPLRHASLGEGLPYFAAAAFAMVTLYVVSGAIWDWRRNHRTAQKSLVQGAAPAESVLPVVPTPSIDDPSVTAGAGAAAVPPPPPSAQTVQASRKQRRTPLTLTVMGIVAIVVALLAAVQTFRVGESGAQAVWGDVLAEAQAAPAPSASASGRVIAMSEVTTHSSATDCWTVINGTVYDLTAWVNEHPGGAGAITSLCGTDGTTSFQSQHRGDAKPESELAGFAIGTVR